MHTCIVEIRFFHSMRDGQSVEEMLQESMERMAEGSSIKTAVRFHSDDTLRAIANKVQPLAKETQTTLEKLHQAPFSQRQFLQYNLRRQADRLYELQVEASDIALKFLKKAALSKDPIAVEENESFRLVKPEELHELIEKANRNARLQVFVFELTDLCSTSARMVGHLL